jgi:hypothetical protein
MSARDVEFPTTVDALEVIEAGEILEFVADWLTEAGPAVAADLARLVDPAFFPLSALIAEARRLAVAFGADPER